MRRIQAMKAWIGFDEEDERHLVALWPAAEPRIPDVIEVFYERILAEEDARSVFESDAQVDRQKRILAVWIRELLQGPWDEAYAARRMRIGTRHVEIGLAHTWMFTAMEVVRDALCGIAWEAMPHADAVATCRAISHVCAIDLALMTGTYSGAREKAQVHTARGLLLSHLPSAALLLDAEDRITEENGLVETLAGPGPRKGRPVLQALPPALCAGAQLADALAMARAGREPVTRERVDVELDGVHRVVRVRVVPLAPEDDGDAEDTILVHLEELTEVVQAEARARQAESLARVGELSAGIAHELRNPLAGISGAIQVLARSFPAEDRRAAVMARVRDQVGRLDRMVRDLLTFSRPPAARLTRLALHDLVDGVVELVGDEADGVAVLRRGEGTALADPDLLHRIVLNLVQNALGMPGVRSVEVQIEDGRVCVCDDGPGVPEALQERIFEPFFTTRTSGTGLGLAICRSGAEAMGGTLTLAPSRTGATFCVTLES